MLEDLGNLGDFVGGLAVIATLLYLALQVRQNSNQIAQNSEWLRAQTYRADQDAHNSITAMVAQQPDLAGIFRRGIADSKSLSEDELTRFIFFFGVMLGNFQSSYYQQSKGLLDPEQWNAQTGTLRFLLRSPGGRKYWESWGTNQSPAFREYVNAEVLNDSDSAA